MRIQSSTRATLQERIDELMLVGISMKTAAFKHIDCLSKHPKAIFLTLIGALQVIMSLANFYCRTGELFKAEL